MLGQIVRQSSLKGGIVLDCFAGSGTTLLAAERLGRSWIGMDNSRVALFAMLRKLCSVEGLSEFRIAYGKDIEESAALDVSFDVTPALVRKGDLFRKETAPSRIVFTGLSSARKYRQNRVGLAFSARGNEAGYHIHKLELLNPESPNCQVVFDPERSNADDHLIVFDIHGNEFVRQLNPSHRYGVSGVGRTGVAGTVRERRVKYGHRTHPKTRRAERAVRGGQDCAGGPRRDAGTGAR